MDTGSEVIFQNRRRQHGQRQEISENEQNHGQNLRGSRQHIMK
jgi:hypothetical protein